MYNMLWMGFERHIVQSTWLRLVIFKSGGWHSMFKEQIPILRVWLPQTKVRGVFNPARGLGGFTPDRGLGLTKPAK